jgi:phosphopantothenoylcysteine decarboxylase/phosphopantothenate--cysteine ligase
MGYALAEEALSRGARVILISAPTALSVSDGVEWIPVETAAQMRAAVLDALPRATMVVKAAAVADFRAAAPTSAKLRRADGMTLRLEPTIDIVAEAVARRAPGTLVIAFAAEIPESGEDAVGRAREKLRHKGVDAIVVNDVSLPGLGFDSESNAGAILLAEQHGGGCIDLPAMPKREMATRILDAATELRRRVGRLSRVPVEA